MLQMQMSFANSYIDTDQMFCSRKESLCTGTLSVVRLVVVKDREDGRFY